MEHGPTEKGDSARKIRSSQSRNLTDSPSESEAVRLTTVNVGAHSPFQLNNPIPVDPEETLPQRLPSSYTDCSVQLERRTRQVSDVFPGDLAKNHIQIIVIVVTGELHASTAISPLTVVILQVHLR